MPMAKKSTFFVFFLLISKLTIAQTSNTGKEFWCAFMGNYSGSTEYRLYLSATETTKVKINIPGFNFLDSLNILKDSLMVYNIAPNMADNQTSDAITSLGIRITSDFPISVASMNLQYATTDASIVLPLVNIPKNPIYFSVNPNSGLNSTALLVSPEDSVLVRIIPTQSISGGRQANVPYTIYLNRGETYQMRSGNSDLTGTKIEVLNDKKLIAFSGDQCSNYPCGACDHQYEQILPDEVLDTAYLITPQYGHTNGYVTKFIPLDTFTNIKINGVWYNNISFRNPITITTNSGDSTLYATSTKKFRCYQFLKGASSCNGYYNSSYGDPAFVCKIGAKSFGQISTFSTVNSSNLRDHYVNIIIRTKSKNIVFHNGLRIDSTEFITFTYNREFSYAKIQLNNGWHRISCNDGHLAYCYGVGFYESYFYLAGFSLPNFDVDFRDSITQINCKDNKFKYDFKAKFSGAVKSVKWYFGDGNTGVGNPVQHTYNNVGVYEVKMVAEDYNNKKDSLIKKIKAAYPVFNPLQDKFSCGDTIKFEELNPFFDNFKWVDSSTLNSFKAFGPARKLWVKATDTSGYCHFQDSSNFYRTEVLSTLNIEKWDTCFNYNKFVLKDQFSVTNGNLVTKVWSIPNVKTWFNEDDIQVNLPMPGIYPVYFDIITESCKLRERREIVVHPNTKPFGKPLGADYCAKEQFTLYDSSKIFGGKIKKIIWSFDNGTKIIESDSTLRYTTSLDFKNEITRPFLHITATDKNCFDTFKNQLLIYPAPKVDFSLSIDSLQCLPNARWTFTSLAQSLDDTTKLYWNTGNGRVGTSLQMRNIRYFNSGEYKVKLIGTNTRGCQDSAIKFVHVFDLPIVDFSINDSIQCLKENLFNLTNNSIGKTNIYSWFLENSFISDSSSIDSIIFSQAAEYSIKLLAYTPVNGCADSLTKILSVKANPNAQFSINNKEQCFDQHNFNFTNLSTHNSVGIRSHWFLNNQNLYTHNIANFKFLNPIKQFIVLKVIDSNSCENQTMDSVLLIDKPSLKISINDSLQCFGQNEFIIKTKNLFNDSNFWYLNNNLLQKNEIDSLLFNDLNFGNYKVKLIKNNSKNCNYMDSVLFKVLEPIKADFLINNDKQCFNGHEFILNDNSTFKDDILNKNIYTLNSTDFNSSNLNYKYNNFGSYLIKYKVVSGQGCSDSIEKPVILYENPMVEILKDSACLNDPITINVNSLTNGQITQWNWNFSDGQLSSNTPPFNLNFLNSGYYNVSLNVKDNNNCESNFNLNNVYQIYDLPNAKFNVSQLNSSANEFNLKFLPLELSNNYQYLWNLPNGESYNVDSATKTFTENLKGKLKLQVTDANGCVNFDEKDINFYSLGFNFFMPNAFSPNEDNFNSILMPILNVDVLDYNFKVINRWGEIVYETNNLNNGWDGSYRNDTVMEGNYTYLISFKYLDGKTYHFRGVITLIY